MVSMQLSHPCCWDCTSLVHTGRTTTKQDVAGTHTRLQHGHLHSLLPHPPGLTSSASASAAQPSSPSSFPLRLSSLRLLLPRSASASAAAPSTPR